MNAVEKFELECLKNACWELAVSCIRPDLVHDLIASANEYSNCKLTNDLFKEVNYKKKRYFIDNHLNSVSLVIHIVRLSLIE